MFLTVIGFILCLIERKRTEKKTIKPNFFGQLKNIFKLSHKTLLYSVTIGKWNQMTNNSFYIETCNKILL